MKAFAATMMALGLWGVWGFTSKISATAGRPPAQVLIFETIGHVVGVLLTVMVFQVGTFQMSVRSMVAPIATGFVGALAMLLFIYALREGKASVVVPVTGLYPAITVGLAYFFLNEPVDARTMAGVACAVLAVALLSR